MGIIQNKVLPVHACSVISNSLQPHGQESPPGSPVHGIFQARTFPVRGTSWPRDQTWVSRVSCIVKWILYHWATWEGPQKKWISPQNASHFSFHGWVQQSVFLLAWLQLLGCIVKADVFEPDYSDNLKKAMAPHCSTVAWKIPWMEEPGRLQSMGLLRVRHDWASSLSLFTFMHWRRKWQPTPVFLPGESQGWENLVGCRLWGGTESDTTEMT